MTPFPTITTERLILREITPADATAMYEYLSDPEVTKQMALDPYESPKAIADEEIRWYQSIREQSTGIRWGITLKDENIVIGSCGFLNRAKQHSRAEIGFELHPAHWRKGIASEAIQAVLSYGFHTYELQRIEAIVDPANTGSRQILQKHGFIEEGRLRQYEYFAGAFQDVLMYSILKTES